MRYAWIDTQRQVYALSEMCLVLEVSINGYRSGSRDGKANRRRLTDALAAAGIDPRHS